MAYTKQNFVDGQTLKAEHLNKIEDGIVAAEANAVPTSRTVNGKALNSNITLSASDVGALPNTTVIPDALSDLKADSTHRTVTDTEKSTWNAKANTSDIPTKVSQLTNDKNYLTSYTETDPTVPSWAKASTKPSYTKGEVGLGNVDNVKQYSASNPPPYPVTKVNNKTGTVTLSASDVGADATGTASSAVSAHNTNTSAHADIREQINQLSSEKVDKSEASLGIASDGLIYLFISGEPVGTGIPQGQSGDVFGYVDANNTIVLNGNLADGTYTVKYEMEDGSVVDIGELSFSFSVNKNLTYCTISNNTASVARGGSYSATITANDGYVMKSIKVTMSGNDISSSVVSGGKITISNVTGDIVITAAAEVYTPSYTNVFKPSEAFINRRVNSSMTLTDADGKVTTGFIDIKGKVPFTNDMKIYIKGATITADGNTKIATYKTEGTSYTNPYSNVNGASMTVNDEGNGVISISNLATTMVNDAVRMFLTLHVSTSKITTDDIQNIVITLNEPIS